MTEQRSMPQNSGWENCAHRQNTTCALHRFLYAFLALKRNNHLLLCRYNTLCLHTFGIAISSCPRSSDCAFVHLDDEEETERGPDHVNETGEEEGFYECYCGSRLDSHKQLEDHGQDPAAEWRHTSMVRHPQGLRGPSRRRSSGVPAR